MHRPFVFGTSPGRERSYLAAHGLAAQGFAAHGFFAAHGLAAQGLAAHGLQGLTIFFAAHGLAAQGFAAHGFAAQGLAVQLATSAVGDGSGAAIAIGVAIAMPVPMASAGSNAFLAKLCDFLVILASLKGPVRSKPDGDAADRCRHYGPK